MVFEQKAKVGPGHAKVEQKANGGVERAVPQGGAVWNGPFHTGGAAQNG